MGKARTFLTRFEVFVEVASFVGIPVCSASQKALFSDFPVDCFL